MKPRKPELPGNYGLRPETLTNQSGWMQHPQPIKDWPQSLFAILIFKSLELMELLNPRSWEALADLNPNSVRSICSQIQLGWIDRLSRLSRVSRVSTRHEANSRKPTDTVTASDKEPKPKKCLWMRKGFCSIDGHWSPTELQLVKIFSHCVKIFSTQVWKELVLKLAGTGHWA